MSQEERWPLRVSPSLSSTSMGWPTAALRRPRGSIVAGVGGTVEGESRGGERWWWSLLTERWMVVVELEM